MDLDTLLHETAAVADPTPRDLAAGRAALDAATTISARRVVAVRHMKRRGLGLSAILAAAASLALVFGPIHNPDPSPIAASPTVATGTSQPAPHPTVDKGKSIAPATLNVSLVLFRAATAAGAQPGGWPDAAYWHTISSYHQGTGPILQRESWMGHTTTGVMTDPRAGGTSSLDVGLFGGFT
jgi:hypothetical protein